MQADPDRRHRKLSTRPLQKIDHPLFTFRNDVPEATWRALSRLEKGVVRLRPRSKGKRRRTTIPTEGEAVPLRQKPDFLPTLAAFNLRRGGSPAPILDRGILPPPHVPRGLLANIVVHEIGGRVGGGREDDIVGAAKLRKSASECRTPGSERGRLPYDLRTDIEGARNCERQLQ